MVSERVRGRSLVPVISIWVALLVVIFLLHLLTLHVQALSSFMRPVYVILLLAALVGTARWARVRDHPDRRQEERREEDRLDDAG